MAEAGRAESLMSLVSLSASSIIALGVLVAVFLVVQFLVIAPFRLWQRTAWITNVERALNGLWDLHDEGVSLLNAHDEFMEDPNWNQNIKVAKWFSEWTDKENDWRQRTSDKLRDFAPAEARRFTNMVVVSPSLQEGVNRMHTHQLNILAQRLIKFGEILERHHPALIPE